MVETVKGSDQMAPGKDQIVLHASESFKDALGAYATTNNTSMADVIRKAVASVIGYDLSTDPARTRLPKYATKAEADRAALDRAALIRWGKTTGNRLLATGEIEAASVIARATINRDYDTLAALKDAATTPTDPDETDDDETGDDD